MKITSVNKYLTVVIAYLLILSACVPARLHEEMKVKKERCEEDLNKLRAENLDLRTKNDELVIIDEELKRDECRFLKRIQ